MAAAEIEQVKAASGDSFIKMIIRRFIKHKLALFGLIITVFLILMSLFGLYLLPHTPTEQSLRNRFAPPSPEHRMGTDELGRDQLARIVSGGRVSIALGFVVSITSVLIGSTLGVVSGYMGGKIDDLLMRFVDFMLSLPLLAVLLIAAFIIGPGFWNMVLVLVIFGWMGICRVVRGETLALKEEEFIQASRALGVPTPLILLRHIIPNVMAPVLVYATLGVGNAILQESYLSYLGLGIQPPTPSWGNMLMNARQYLSSAPWLALWPGFFIFITILAFNFMGDGLRDALDPKLKMN